MTVASRTFVLASAEEGTRLRRECLRAARRGGGLVRVAAADDEHVDVLVTPGLAVFFDVVPIQSPIGAVDENASFEWEYTGAL